MTFPTPGSRQPKQRLALLAAGLLTCAATFTALPAANADEGHNGKFRLGDPKEHYMGSQVAEHEGDGAGAGSSTKQDNNTYASVQGNDVSHWQGDINWPAVYDDGARFTYIKATEGTSYRDPKFADNYVGSYNAGFVRGAYHFARPDGASGGAQANYFADHGGAWSADNQTLPGVLDIEYAPSGDACYGLGQSAMRNWIADFINTYHDRTGRWAVIYTTTSWWKQCTGNYGGFADNNPLWIARWASSPGELPNGWSYYTFWQTDNEGRYPGDQDVFNGSYDRLRVLANNG
ncbi:MAG: lysozyme [Streptosporangiales bacterium]|nr:lysozyme [Streptosporangiales bacterium]